MKRKHMAGLEKLVKKACKSSQFFYREATDGKPGCFSQGQWAVFNAPVPADIRIQGTGRFSRGTKDSDYVPDFEALVPKAPVVEPEWLLVNKKRVAFPCMIEGQYDLYAFSSEWEDKTEEWYIRRDWVDAVEQAFSEDQWFTSNGNPIFFTLDGKPDGIVMAILAPCLKHMVDAGQI